MSEEVKKERYVSNLVLVYIVGVAFGVFLFASISIIGYDVINIKGGFKIPVPKLEIIPLVASSIIPLFLVARATRYKDLDKKSKWI